MSDKLLLSGPILITGASGFVGSHLARSLVAEGAEVHALVRKTSNLWRLRNVLPTLRLHYGDLADKDSVAAVVREVKPRGIFHLGVSNVLGGLGEGNAALVNTNVSGTIGLLDAVAAAGVDFFVQMGSFLEYGPKDHPVKEDEPCEPVELYGITKLVGTLYARTLARSLPSVALRLFTPYGPHNEPKRLTHMLISSALTGTPVSLTAPSISRDFIFVEDVAALLLEAAEKAEKYRGEIFNAGSGVRTSLNEAAELILKLTHSQSTLTWRSFRDVSYDSDAWQADMTKTFSHFSWRPTVSLEEGLRRTIAHYKTHGH